MNWQTTHAAVKVYDAPHPWRVVGAAVRGTSHALRDQPCQDAEGWRLLAGGGLVVAVADGAGSAKLSQYGSSLAVETALAAAEEGTASLLKKKGKTDAADWEALLLKVFKKARLAVVNLAHAELHWTREYATTLTVAIAAGGWLAVGQVGDGAVVALDDQDEMFAATHLQKGEYANETHFLTQRDALKRVEIWVQQRPIKAVAAMSDGLVRLALKLPSGDPFRPFFQPLFGFVGALKGSVDEAAQAATCNQLAGFLASERVCARTDDDKSLVLAAYVAGMGLPARNGEWEAAVAVPANGKQRGPIPDDDLPPEALE